MSQPDEAERRSAPEPSVSPVPDLVAFIESDHPGEDLISFPPEAADAISQCRSSGFKFSTKDIEDLMNAIDSYEYPFCKLIDEPSLVLINSVVMYSKPCGARHRGFFIIAESLHPASDDDALTKKQQRSNKLRLGDGLPWLLKHISLRSETDQTRRWMSILALELLEGCPENVEMLRGNQSQQWLGLTEILKHGKCEILRLLAGSIIRQMLSYGIPSDAFWTPQDITDSLDRFPLASEQDPRWIADFDSYVQEMVTKLSLQERSNVFFAHTAFIRGELSVTEDESVIFVTVSGLLLQAFVQAPSGRQTTHIDIPLEHVTDEVLIPSAIEQLEDSMYTIRILLVSPTEITCYINAEPRRHEVVEFAFDSKYMASKLMRLLRPDGAVEMNVPTSQRPQALAASNPISVGSDNKLDEQVNLVNPAENSISTGGDTDLIATAARATSLIPSMERPPTLMSQPSLLNGQARPSLKAANEERPISKLQKSRLKDRRPTLESHQSLQNGQITSQTQRGQGLARTHNVTSVTSEASVNVSTLLDTGILHSGGPKASQRRPSMKPKTFTHSRKEREIGSKSAQQKTENASEYEIPESPPLSPRKNFPSKRALKSASKKTVKGQNASKVASKARAQQKLSKKVNAPIEAPIPLVQRRSRRAAALDANKKIQGINTSNGDIQGAEGQKTFQRRNNMLQDGTELQNDLLETVGSADVGTVASKASVEDAIESVTEAYPSHSRHVGSQKAATKKKSMGERIDLPASVAQKPDNREAIALPQVNRERLERDMLKLQYEAPQAQKTQNRHSDTAADESKGKSVPNIYQEPDRQERFVPETKTQARNSRPSRNQDPFASKLSAVVAKGESSNLEVTDRVADFALDRIKPRKAPQETQHALGQRVSTHSNGALATPSLQTLDAEVEEPIQRPKRKAIVQPRSVSKKAKSTTVKSLTPRVLTEKTPPLASRKTPIISFSTSGPRNQGITLKSPASNTKPQVSNARLATSGNVVGETHNAVHGFEVPAALKNRDERQQQQQVQPNITIKGPQHLQAFSADVEPLIFSDQQQPPMRLQDRLKQHLRTEIFPSKASSQTTRVNHNGSPMPIRQLTSRPISSQSHETLREDEDQAYPDQEQHLGNGESVFLAESDEEEDGDDEVLQLNLPSRNEISQASVPLMGAYAWVNTSKNKKQIPSSPQAPSSTSALPAHHVYQTGELINPYTEEKIIPSHPQDPFTGQGTRLSSFTRLLRNASEKGTKRPAEATSSDHSKKVRLSTRTSFVDDPDRTLVKPLKRPPKTKLQIDQEVSSSSSLEETSESDLSPTLMDNETEDTPKQWGKALLPHQRDVLDALTQISHRLLAHMIKSEDAFMDLIADFDKGGNLLIDHLEKEHEAENVARIASTEALKQKMIGLYRKTSADLEFNANKIMGRTNEVEKEWRAHQESVMAMANAALARYAV